MSDWFETPQGQWNMLWSTLGLGVEDAKHPARRPTFATVSPDGWPQARTVVLRSADREMRAVTIHTDLYSDKILSLRAIPRAALHIWVPQDDLQIRLQADVTIQSGDGVRDLWDKTPDHAQQSYGVTPPPGAPIQHALDYAKSPDPKTFAVLHCSLCHVDLVHLGADHRRVAFSQECGWQAQWLSP